MQPNPLSPLLGTQGSSCTPNPTSHTPGCYSKANKAGELPGDTKQTKGLVSLNAALWGCGHWPSQFFLVLAQASLHFSEPSKREGRQRSEENGGECRALGLHSESPLWETCLNSYKREDEEAQVPAGPRQVLVTSVLEGPETLRVKSSVPVTRHSLQGQHVQKT